MALFYDATIAACCAQELHRRLQGARIREVHQPSRLDLCLEFEGPRSERFLVASANAQWARLHLARARPETTSKRTAAFLLWARKHLRRAVVESLAAEPFDRIVRMALHPPDPWMPGPVRWVIFEIMGKHSNILCLDAQGTILEAVKHVTPDLSRFRTVLPHIPYIPPPVPRGLNPLHLAAEDLGRAISERSPRSETIPEVLRTAVAGLSRTLAEELVAAAGLGVETLASEMDGDGPRSLADQVRAWAERVTNGEFEPVRIHGGTGIPRYYAFPLPRSAGPGHFERTESLGLEIERAAAEEAARQGTAEVKTALTQGIRREIAGLEERRTDLCGQMVPPEEGEELRRCGEALLIHLAEIDRGQKSASVDDPYTGGRRVIPLRPEWSPQRNAEEYFRRYRAARRRAEIVPKLIGETEDSLARCRALLAQTVGAQGLAPLRQIARSAASAGIRLPDTAPSGADILVCHSAEPGRGRLPRQVGAQGLAPLRLTSTDGYAILLGQNAKQNEWLLRHGARPDDFWFHARDIHGGHVIVLTDRQPERVPPSTLEEAASFAAHLSKSRHSALVPVDYTLRKFVRKAKKGPPGKVIYEREKTLMVEPKAPKGAM